MDDNELVDRLRWVSEWYFVDPVDGKAYASDDPLDAADRIEALSAENERLREALHMIKTGRCVTDWIDQPHEQMQDCASAALGDTK